MVGEVDVDEKEIWQTLEATHKSENNENFDEISEAILSAIIQQI